MIPLLLLLSVSPLFAAESRVDINTADRAMLETLPLSDQQVDDIIQYRTYVDFFQDIYDLREIASIDQETLLRLRPLVKVSHYSDQDETAERREEIAYLIERLGNNEGQQEGMSDVWEDYLLSPRNINTMYFSDINNFPSVSPVDAAAVVQRITNRDSIHSWRDLRQTPGIAYYGARNLRNYVYYQEEPLAGRVYGDYQMKYYDGLLDDEMDGVIVRPRNERAPSVMNKLRLRFENRWKAGLMYNAQKGERTLFELDSDLFLSDSKYYLGYEDKLPVSGFPGDDPGYLRVYGGHYRATFGEGLVMENTDFYSARKTGMGFSKRITGIIGDVSRSQEFSLRGGALEWKRHNMGLAVFMSYDEKDAVLYDSNGDGKFGDDADSSVKDKVFGYITMSNRPYDDWRVSSTSKLAPLRDVLEETLYGAHLEYSPWIGTHLGYTVYQADYNREFYMPDTVEGLQQVLVQKSSDYDKMKITDAEVAAMYSGRDWRRVQGLDWRTVIENFSLQGEYAELYKDGGLGEDPHALLVSGYTQYENFHFMAMYRDYDLAFDNPYSRGFSEANKFEDTILEKDYYLTDPTLIDLYNNTAQAQAERGWYFETRYQFSRYFTLTRAYVDLWERKSDNRRAVRFQGELEYRPFFQWRIRLKHKHQIKRYDDYADRGVSITDETTFLVRTYLSGRDQIQLEYRWSQVDMPPYVNLSNDADPVPPGGENSGVAAQSVINGDYLSAEYTHYFTEDLRVRGAFMYWDGHGVSHWDWEDMEIDFMGQRGVKYWFTIHDRIADNLFITLKYRVKRYKAKEIDLRNYNEDVDEPLYAATVYNTEQSIRLQIDWKF